VIRGKGNMVGIRGGAEEKKRDNEVFEKVISYGLRLGKRQKKPCILLAILARTRVLKDLRKLHNLLVAD
jgi:hypothetical protein